MPIYEYRCSACGHELEAIQKFSDAPLITCPSCSRDTLAKLVSAAGFQLKGSGWYVTDFKAGSTKPAAKEGTGDGAGDSKGDAKTDGKPATATKTESKSGAATESNAGAASAKSETGSSSTTS
jgi:putative FmdB family regulatory protein